MLSSQHLCAAGLEALSDVTDFAWAHPASLPGNALSFLLCIFNLCGSACLRAEQCGYLL